MVIKDWIGNRYLKSEKNAFWEALVITILVFLIGLIIGFFLESLNQKNIEQYYIESEVQLLDLNMQQDLLFLNEIDCVKAIERNINFGDKIYEEALLLQKLEDSETLSEGLKVQHKKYDLLRTLFWINSIKIRQSCPDQFHTVVYVYEYEPDLNGEAVQTAFSRYLSDLKNAEGDRMVLIPIAGNMNLFSIKNMLQDYGIDKFPTIIVDEQYKITKIEDLDIVKELVEEKIVSDSFDSGKNSTKTQK